MNKLFTLILILYTIGQVSAQIKITSRVLDESTQSPIAYVNIGITTLDRGTISDDEGYFSIEGEESSNVVSFSSIGYEGQSISLSELKELGEILLKPKAYLIDQVEVVAERWSSENVLLGEKNKNRGHSISFGSAQLGTEIGAAIAIDRQSYLKSANFVFNHAKGDSLLMRVNIYDFSTGEVGANILSDNILIKDRQRKGLVSVDLTPYDLVVDHDVLLTLEWLRDFDEIGNKGITFDTKKSKKLKGVYLRHFSNGSFEKMDHPPKRKPCFYFIAKQIE